MHELTGTLCARYRLRGVAVITYLNDKLYAKPGFVPTARQRNTVVPHCEQLGFWYKRNKVPLPRRPIDFLGITAHLAAPVLSPPPKLQRYVTFATDLVQPTDSWQLRKLAKLAGVLAPCSLAVPTARLWPRKLHQFLHPPPTQPSPRPTSRRPQPDDLHQSKPPAQRPTLRNRPPQPPCRRRQRLRCRSHRRRPLHQDVPVLRTSQRSAPATMLWHYLALGQVPEAARYSPTSLRSGCASIAADQPASPATPSRGTCSGPEACLAIHRHPAVDM